jgi:Flp pilus assembly protein TadD
LLTEGQELLDGGAMLQAVAKFDRALEQEADNRFALSRSGFALVQLGRWPQAIDRLRRALELDGEQPETRSLLAEALGYAGENAAAVKEWMEVVRLQPTVARHWSNLGAALGKAGRLSQAVAALDRARALEPESSERLKRLAFAEFSAGRLESSADHLQKAAAREEGDFGHSAALGLILVQLQRPGEARRWLATAGPGEPEYGEARLSLARLEVSSGRVEAARRALAEALASAPGLRSRAQADPMLEPLLDPR